MRPAFLSAIALSSGIALWLSISPLEAQKPATGQTFAPRIAAASDEAMRAIPRIRVPKGLKVDLFAAEPMLANPVCFCVDERGRFFVAETFRLHAGVTDIRGHMNWLDDDLASRTVGDRIALYKKYLGAQFKTTEVAHDRVRLIEDVDGDGRADRSTVFADGFHNAEEGIGAGLVAHHGKVWYSCIPNLWLLEDAHGSGKADTRRALQTGYGLHVGFIGHDCHGLRFGPDGKLYFSIGDRGLHVITSGATVSSPDTGAVLRCNPDGSELEIVATGLRNPQELAFDDHGNLFTGDNNADHGDKARLVYVVEGGDSGWRIGYQFMNIPMDLGPWNSEKLWHPQWEGQAAYIVPPLANVADGPSGLTFNPGTSQLPERYQGHFFLCDFRGSSGHSGIRSFGLRPRGAAFEMVDQHEMVWSVLATDVDFGMDGGLYFTDWVEGWDLPNKGRIYKVGDPKRAKDPVLQNVKNLMAEGMGARSSAELAKLLEHPDMRVRLEAQFALAERGSKQARGKDDAIKTLTEAARRGPSQLARLHALWGLGQIGRKAPTVVAPVASLLKDADTEVRAQAAKVLGECRLVSGGEAITSLLHDPAPRVRFLAALALGKIGTKKAVGPVLEMVRDNADADPYLRHAGVMALAGINDLTTTLAAAKDSSAAVRMAVLLALRRWQRAEVAIFLNDPEPRLVLEAARAISDVPIPGAFPPLAALVSRSGLSEPLLYRVLNAHFRLGKPENARALAAFAGRGDVPEALKIEALRELGEWEKPSGRDRIIGVWRPLPPRPANAAREAIAASLGTIFSGPVKVQQQAAQVATKLGIKEVGPLLWEVTADIKQPALVRVETLKGLQALHDPHIDAAIQLALTDSDPRLRAAGLRSLAEMRPIDAISKLEQALAHGTQIEKQSALAALGDMSVPAADKILSRWLDLLQAHQVLLELQLDLIEAAHRRSAPEIKEKLARYEAARPRADSLAEYRETLAGGNNEAGKRIFFEKAAVSCLRCHKVNGQGGEVGPDLTGIGTRQKREYLLESIVDPNKQMAKGFETIVLGLKNGQIRVGILKSEDAREVRLMTSEGQQITVAKDQIEERGRGKSAMPEDIIKSLSKPEVRDLVEYLATLK